METIESLGKYEVKSTLGRGAMGIVYEGWDPIIARRVAIKTVKLPDNTDDAETEDALARFRREAQAAGRLTHPNIVGVFDYGETNNVAYIVMEFVDGPPLKNLLDKQERFALADTLRIMEDVLAGLQFSHERGVVHRDIKPANVMLTSTGQGKIADFGIARIESSSMTQAGTLLGTPAYMSPEQFMGQVVDARTDIYSSGVLLYQLLTGERPFEGGLSAIMHKALNTEPPWPSQLSVTVPPAFDAVVKRAMAKRPEDRFPSAKAFAEAMRAAMTAPAEPLHEDEATMFVAPAPARSAATPQAARPAHVAAPPSVAASRSSLPMIAGAAVVGLGVLGGGAWWMLSRPAPPAQIAEVTPPPKPAAPEVTAPPLQSTDTTQTQQVTTPPPVQPSAPVAPAAPVAASSAPVAPAASVAASNAPVAPVAPTAAPAQPDAQQVAMANLSALRGQIAQWAASRQCATLGGNVGDGGTVTLTGFAGNPQVAGLREGATSFAPPGQTSWRVQGVDPVFCQTLNTLHPLVPAFGSTGSPQLGLQMADGRTRLHDGDEVKVRLAMPDYPSNLRVDYVAHDGSVQHLYPQIADPRNHIAADPPHVYNAGQTVNLANPAWQIAEPYGTDMIIAIASSQPLLDRPRPNNAEKLDVYLRDLQAGIDNARQRGATIAASAITLDALPK